MRDGEEGRDRRGTAVSSSAPPAERHEAVAEHRRELLARRAGCRGPVEDGCEQLRGGAREGRVDERGHVPVAESVERDHGRPPRSPEPGGMALLDLGTGSRDEEEREPGAVGGEVSEEGDQGVVGPVEVLHDQHGRAGVRDRLEEPAPGGEGLLLLRRARWWSRGRPVARPGPCIQARSSGSGSVRTASSFADSVDLVVGVEDARVGLDDLAQGPEADPVAVRQAAADTPGDEIGQGVHVSREFADEPRLADAGVRDDVTISSDGVERARSNRWTSSLELEGRGRRRGRLGVELSGGRAIGASGRHRAHGLGLALGA